MKLYLLHLLLLFTFTGYSQVDFSPYISSGYMNHLGRNGLNYEIGFDMSFKRINVSPSYRNAILDKQTTYEVQVKGFSFFVSYVLINKEQHKLMIGPGLTSGHYKRYTREIGFEKEYDDLWFNFFKIRYDYILKSNIKIGIDVSEYGDDGDDALYIGLVLGYRFN